MKDLSGYDIPDPPPMPDDDDTVTQDNVNTLKLGYPGVATTAFTVVLTRDGHWVGISNLVDGSLPDLSFIKLDREAAVLDMMHGGAMVGQDASNQLVIQFTTQHIVNTLQKSAQQAQENQRQAMENQRVLSKIKSGH